MNASIFVNAAIASRLKTRFQDSTGSTNKKEVTMKKRSQMALMVCLSFCIAIFALAVSPVQAGDGPPGGGLTLTTKKPLYSVGENVVFSLYKYAGVDDTPANMKDCYYVITHQRPDGVWREFYTSRKNPFPFTVLGLEKKFNFGWDQKDNERTHQAKPGNWRIKLFAPNANISKPLVAKFIIQ